MNRDETINLIAAHTCNGKCKTLGDLMGLVQAAHGRGLSDGARIASASPVAPVAAVPEWISVDDGLPEDQQSVAFVVNSKNTSWDYLNGRVLGGTFVAGRSGGFGVPGLIIGASHWMPLPIAPEVKS